MRGELRRLDDQCFRVDARLLLGERKLIADGMEWEEALEGVAASLRDLDDCRIPIEMLRTTVRYAKTGDERHLLSLPLEQRELLEDVLPHRPR